MDIVNMCTLLPLTYSSLKVNSPHVYGTIEQLLIPFNLCLFFGFRMLVCMYSFTNIWYHQQLTIQSLCFFHVILFRSQTYHMSLSKILWLHRLCFTMGKLTQRRAVGDDPGNVNINAWRWSKIMKLSWNHHQSNPSLSYSTSKQIVK